MNAETLMQGDMGMRSGAGTSAATVARLSYKFQRLRERLRAAIASGELNGKLPGERQLAKRFHVNAKTLSKALTDLAAEGLLDRSIGRGTFVKGSEPSSPISADRWLILCEPEQASSATVGYLKQANPGAQVVTDTTDLRPSFLSPIKAVIDLSMNTPDSLLRDLLVRNITVVLVGREPTTYSVNAVVQDRALAASQLARDMTLMGHRRFLVVERRGQTCVANAVRNAIGRYAADATVDSAFPADVPAAVDQGITAIICDCRKSAAHVRDLLDARGVPVPQRVSLAAMGAGWGDYPCSGYFVHSQQKAEAVLQLLRESNGRRPTTLWMAGSYFDAGTMAALQPMMPPAEAADIHPRYETVSA